MPRSRRPDGDAVEGEGHAAERLVELQAVIGGLRFGRGDGNLSEADQSNLPESTTTPPVTVPLPVRYLVVE